MARAFILMEALEAENRGNQNTRMRHLRRHLRNQARPMELPNFSAHYRLTKKLVADLCSELEPLLPRPRRRTKVSTECKVSTLLFHSFKNTPRLVLVCIFFNYRC